MQEFELNILHVIPSAARRYGGPSAAIFPMMASLNRLPDVHAEAAMTDADGAEGRIAAADLPGDATVHLFRRNWSERWKPSLGLGAWLIGNVHKYDLIHIHALWSFATAAAASAARRRQVPYVIRPAGMLSEYSWRRGRWTKRLYWNAIERRNVRGAVGFHTTSDAESAEVCAVKPNAAVYVIPNGIEPGAFTHPREPNQLRIQCGESALGKPIVLFLSRLHPKKGIVDRLLPAIAAMRHECCLVIAGGPDSHAPGHEAEVRAAIKKLALEGRVILFGSLEGDRRWSLFDGADVFVLPSHSENFGIVVAEAMARGCPVVVSDEVQSAAHVTAAQAGDVVAGDPAALSAALDRILSQPETAKAYGDAGRRYAAQNFNWDRIAEQLNDMYRHCLSCR